MNGELDTTNCIFYRQGFKYQLFRDYTVELSFAPPYDIHTQYIDFVGIECLNGTVPNGCIHGELTARAGYAWDGPSGPTFDTPTFMRGSLVHDEGYQLMREGHLDTEVYRPLFDEALYDICIEDGMNPIRAFFVRRAVRRFAGPAANPKNLRPVIIAPALKPRIIRNRE